MFVPTVDAPRIINLLPSGVSSPIPIEPEITSISPALTSIPPAVTSKPPEVISIPLLAVTTPTESTLVTSSYVRVPPILTSLVKVVTPAQH